MLQIVKASKQQRIKHKTLTENTPQFGLWRFEYHDYSKKKKVKKRI